jgi:hypothetical protein
MVKALIDSDDIFVCTTVLLETEWVLRSVYGYTPAQLAKALAAFAGLPGVALEDPVLLTKHWIGRGEGWISPMRSI